VESGVATDPNLVFGNRTLYMTKDGKVELREAGDYIIRAKVLWRHGHEDTCTISAYSPIKIDMKPIASVKNFQTKYLTLLAERNPRGQPLTPQSVLVSGSYQNYMYAMVENRGNRVLACSILFTRLKNLKLSKPGQVSANQFIIEIAPGSSRLVFLKVVDCFQDPYYNWSWDFKLF